MKKWGHLSSFQVSLLKCKSIKAIYIYAYEKSCYALLESGIFYCGMT